MFSKARLKVCLCVRDGSSNTLSHRLIHLGDCTMKTDVLRR